MRAATRAMRSGCCDDARRSRSEEMWTRITRCSDRRSYHPRRVSLSLLGRSKSELRTLTTEILSLTRCDATRRSTRSSKASFAPTTTSRPRPRSSIACPSARSARGSKGSAGASQSVLHLVRRTRVDDDVRRPLSDSEFARVVAAAGHSGSRDRTIVVFLAATGLRSNEAREARCEDLDLATCTFTVRSETSKFGRSRVVQFHPAVARELDRYLSRTGTRREAPLFPTDEGRTFSTEGWEKVFQRIRLRAGVATFNAHVLRHTWATNFMRQPGADLLQLKRLGGWARWEMVERYSHAIPVRDRNALPNPLNASSNASTGQPPVRTRSALNRLSA